MAVPFDFGFWTRDEAEEPFVPTEADFEEAKTLDGHCCECGSTLANWGCPYCDDDEPDDYERDVTNYDEYDGPFGLYGGTYANEDPYDPYEY